MIRNWLNKPYFFLSDRKLILLISSSIGVFIFLFLYVFKPFGLYSVLNNTIYYSLGFGVITFITTLLAFIGIPLLFKKVFSNDSWTVGKNIIFIFSLVFSIAIFNWLYNKNVQITTDQVILISLKEMLLYTFSLGCFPVMFYMYISEKIFSKKRIKASKEIMKHKKNAVIKENEQLITFLGNNKKEHISFKLNNLIYISSQGNYATFFLNSDEGVVEEVLRVTMTNIISDLTKYKNIIRCHKSYIINTNYIDSISGNARGYFLTTSTLPQQIPVSRSFSKENLKKFIN